MEFQEKEALETADFTTEYKNLDFIYPLGEAPMLPNTITYVPKSDVSSYAFKAQDGEVVTFNLNQQLLYSLPHILMTATQKTTD